MERIKSFTDISELQPREQDYYSEFSKLNQVIEVWNSIDPYSAVYKAYIQAILNIWESWIDISQNTELDNEVQYLVDKVWVTNQILSFLDAKYIGVDSIMWNLLMAHNLIYPEELPLFTHSIKNISKWWFVLDLYDNTNTLIKNIKIPFDIEWNSAKEIEEFDNQLMKIDIEKYMTEYQDIQMICEIKKRK